MSVCSPCTRSLNLPLCLDGFNIGIIDPDTPIYIYIKNHSTERLIRIQGMSAVNGLVVVDTNDITFNRNHSYEVWVTEMESMKIDDRLTMTHETDEDTTYTCLNVRFDRLYDKDTVTAQYY